MNECEQLHPLLRGYLEDELSAQDRRSVARHLNLCASARKELDRLRGGGPKTPVTSAAPPTEPWDLKILRWLYKTPPTSTHKESETPQKKARVSKESPSAPPPGRRSSPVKPILGILVIFVALAFLTHFVQNASDNTVVKDLKRWLAKNHIFGVTSSLDLVLDLTNLPHWSGNAAPVAFPYQELITDPDRFNVYWSFLQPGAQEPNVDFTKNSLAIVFFGEQSNGGNTARFKRVENYADKTIFWYDESTSGEANPISLSRSWVLQMVPKPTQQPALIQKIQ